MHDTEVVKVDKDGNTTRIVPETEEWWDTMDKIAELKNKRAMKENKEVYNSLEEILQDMIDQKRRLTIMSKLQNTIDSQRYIVTGTGDNIKE